MNRKIRKQSLKQLMLLLKQKMPEYVRQYDVKSFSFFGSYVRGEEKKGSDLDILVEFNKTPTMFQFLALEEQLSKLLGVNVDLVMKSALKRRIAKNIFRELVAV